MDNDSDPDVLITGFGTSGNLIARLYTNGTVSPCALTVSIAPASSTICAGASLTLTASGATSYVWSNAQSTTAITASPASTTAYSVTGTTGACSATATVNPPTAIMAQPTASSPRPP